MTVGGAFTTHIAGTQVSDGCTISGRVITYTLQCHYSDVSWTVQHTFDEMLKFYNRLKRQDYPSLPDFPPSSLVQLGNPNFLLKRKEGIEECLKRLTEIDDITTLPLVLTFFDFSKPDQVIKYQEEFKAKNKGMEESFKVREIDLQQQALKIEEDNKRLEERSEKEYKKDIEAGEKLRNQEKELKEIMRQREYELHDKVSDFEFRVELEATKIYESRVREWCVQMMEKMRTKSLQMDINLDTVSESVNELLMEITLIQTELRESENRYKSVQTLLQKQEDDIENLKNDNEKLVKENKLLMEKDCNQISTTGYDSNSHSHTPEDVSLRSQSDDDSKEASKTPFDARTPPNQTPLIVTNEIKKTTPISSDEQLMADMKAGLPPSMLIIPQSSTLQKLEQQSASSLGAQTSQSIAPALTMPIKKKSNVRIGSYGENKLTSVSGQSLLLSPNLSTEMMTSPGRGMREHKNSASGQSLLYSPTLRCSDLYLSPGRGTKIGTGIASPSTRRSIDLSPRKSNSSGDSGFQFGLTNLNSQTSGITGTGPLSSNCSLMSGKYPTPTLNGKRPSFDNSSLLWDNNLGSRSGSRGRGGRDMLLGMNNVTVNRQRVSSIAFGGGDNQIRTMENLPAVSSAHPSARSGTTAMLEPPHSPKVLG